MNMPCAVCCLRGDFIPIEMQNNNGNKCSANSFAFHPRICVMLTLRCETERDRGKNDTVAHYAAFILCICAVAVASIMMWLISNVSVGASVCVGLVKVLLVNAQCAQVFTGATHATAIGIVYNNLFPSEVRQPSRNFAAPKFREHRRYWQRIVGEWREEGFCNFSHRFIQFRAKILIFGVFVKGSFRKLDLFFLSAHAAITGVVAWRGVPSPLWMKEIRVFGMLSSSFKNRADCIDLNGSMV